MPKVNLSNLEVVHSCPHCPKRFAAITSVYAHVRQVHGKSYSAPRGACSIAPSITPSITPSIETLAQASEAENKLREDFIDDIITVEEYQDGIDKLRQIEQLEQLKKLRKLKKDNYVPLDMNLTPFLDHDLELCLAYLLRDSEKFQRLGKIVKSGNVLELLQTVYKGQFRIKDDKISYWNGTSIITKDYTSKNIRSLYGSVLDAYSLYYMDKANSLVSNAGDGELADSSFHEVQTYLSLSHDIQEIVVSRNIQVDDSLLSNFSDLVYLAPSSDQA